MKIHAKTQSWGKKKTAFRVEVKERVRKEEKEQTRKRLLRKESVAVRGWYYMY